ncbi:hypothetical protein [Nostoc sp. PCC 9305]|uniref:hypothetical protein n=1 Tax=Nostoc sp. PCC 9305 TaxID=296636 RepID=UPI0039C694C0
MKAVRPPLFLTLAATVVAVAIALPLLYLIIHTAGIGGEELWKLISRPRNISIYFNSAAMAATVTLFSTLIAVCFARLWYTIAHAI